MTEFRRAVRDGGTITENRWAGSAWAGDRDITSWARAASAVTLRRYVREAKLHGVDTEIHVAKGDHWIDFATDQAVS